MTLPDGIELPDGIRTLDGVTGRDEVAVVELLSRESAKTEIDLVWWETIAETVDSETLRGENDKGWRWAKDVGTVRSEAGKYGYSWAARLNGCIQGAILYKLNGVSELRPDLPALSVWKLATAPWNREWLQKPPLFRGIGHGLLRFAIQHSFRYGLGGRLALEAYNDERLVRWYQSFGFQLVSTLPEGISLLELTEDVAANYL